MSPVVGAFAWPIIVATELAALGWTAAARAEAQCPMRVVSTGAPKWEAATREVARRTLSASDAAHDCRSIEVTVLADGTARLVFTTINGGRAERLLQSPDELASAVEALLVTVAARPSAPLADATANRPKDELPVKERAYERAPEPPSRSRFLIGADAGARFTFPRKYLTPTLSLRAATSVGHWALGLHAEWDPLLKRVSGAEPTGFAMSALVVGGRLGRREWGGRFEASYGVELGIASVASASTAAQSRSVDASQPRAGLYAGVSYPSDKRTRFTLNVLSDAALSGIRGPATAAAGLPPLPRYGVVLSFGFETVVL